MTASEKLISSAITAIRNGLTFAEFASNKTNLLMAQIAFKGTKPFNALLSVWRMAEYSCNYIFDKKSFTEMKGDNK